MRTFYPGITIYKLAGALLVLMAHALFFPSMTRLELPELLSFLLLASRVVVPCFYVAAGFLLCKGWSHAASPPAYVRRYVLRIVAVYAIFCLWFAGEHILPALYLGGLDPGHLLLQSKILFMAVFVNGPMLQLWFIPPLLFGALASYWLSTRLPARAMLLVLLIAYVSVQPVSGSLLGVTAALTGASDGLAAAQSPLGYALLGATRYLGFGLTFVGVGVWVARHEERFRELKLRRAWIWFAALVATETALLSIFASWTVAYKLTFAILPGTMLLFFVLLRIRSAAVTLHRRLLNLFSIIAFAGHIPFMRINEWLLGWGAADEPQIWQHVLQTVLTFAECAFLTVVLHRRSRGVKTVTTGSGATAEG